MDQGKKLYILSGSAAKCQNRSRNVFSPGLMTALQSAGKKKTAEVLKPTEVCTLGKSRRNQWVNFDVHSCPKVCFNLKVEEQGVLPPA